MCEWLVCTSKKAQGKVQANLLGKYIQVILHKAFFSKIVSKENFKLYTYILPYLHIVWQFASPTFGFMCNFGAIYYLIQTWCSF